MQVIKCISGGIGCYVTHLCSWHCSSGCVFGLADGHSHQWYLCLSLIISWEARPPHFTASGYLALPRNTYLSTPAVCCALPNSSSSSSIPVIQTEIPDSAPRNSAPCYWHCIKKGGLPALWHDSLSYVKVQTHSSERDISLLTPSYTLQPLSTLALHSFAKQFSVNLHLSATHWWNLGHYICA